MKEKDNKKYLDLNIFIFKIQSVCWLWSLCTDLAIMFEAWLFRPYRKQRHQW